MKLQTFKHVSLSIQKPIEMNTIGVSVETYLLTKIRSWFEYGMNLRDINESLKTI